MTHEYVPAVSPVAYGETVIWPGVTPADGLSDIHEPPCTSAVKFIAEPVLLVTLIAFGAGAVDLSVKNKSRLVESTSLPPPDGTGALLTVSIALLLAMFPAELLTITEKLEPLSVVVVVGVV